MSKGNFLVPFLFAFLIAIFSLSNHIVFEEAEGGILLRYLKTISFAVFGYCSSLKKTGLLCKLCFCKKIISDCLFQWMQCQQEITWILWTLRQDAGPTAKWVKRSMFFRARFGL